MVCVKKCVWRSFGFIGGVTIGNNVFIGMRSTVLKGVHIGNNVIIGANSLVNHDVPDNCVVAGNPCKVIMTIDEYYEKRRKAQVSEATELVKTYREVYGKEVDTECLREFFWLFSDANDRLPVQWEQVNSLCGNIDQTHGAFVNHKKAYNSLDEFLDSI